MKADMAEALVRLLAKRHMADLDVVMEPSDGNRRRWRMVRLIETRQQYESRKASLPLVQPEEVTSDGRGIVFSGGSGMSAGEAYSNFIEKYVGPGRLGRYLMDWFMSDAGNGEFRCMSRPELISAGSAEELILKITAEGGFD